MQPTPDAFSHHNPLHPQDPYGHINHYNTSQHQYVNPSDRHHLLGNDPLNIQRSFPAYDTRRNDYGVPVSRPEVLIPHGRHNDLDAHGLLNIPNPGLGPMEEPTVSA